MRAGHANGALVGTKPDPVIVLLATISHTGRRPVRRLPLRLRLRLRSRLRRLPAPRRQCELRCPKSYSVIAVGVGAATNDRPTPRLRSTTPRQMGSRRLAATCRTRRYQRFCFGRRGWGLGRWGWCGTWWRRRLPLVGAKAHCIVEIVSGNTARRLRWRGDAERRLGG